MALSGYFIKKMGANRGKPRIWLENLEVSSAGLNRGDRYDIRIKGGVVSLQANPDGSRVVSGKTVGDRDVPIIDLNSQELLRLFEGMDAIRLVQRKGEIFLLPLATEVRKKERLNRLKHKVLNEQPLRIGAISHGVGLLSSAVHDGLNRAGLPVEKGIVNEIRPELIDHASRGAGWNSNTIPIAAPMQELAFDEGAMRNLPRMEGVEIGIPCSGASTAGRAKRGTSVPEEHPEVGHLVVAALMIIAKVNPAFVMLECVVPMASSGTAAILRNQFRDLGYNVHETVLEGSDFNALENRKRWCLVAVTQGMHFDWEMLQKPAKRDLLLSDVLEPIPLDSPMWTEMKHLKDKEIRDAEAGKSFKMQIFTGDSDHIGTLRKGYAKAGSTDPLIAHPENPNLLRPVTVVEHARVKQWPPSIVQGLSKTVAHEALGQGVIRDPFEAAAKLLGESILDYVHDGRFSSQHLVQMLADHIEDNAAQVVSQVSSPMPNVKYEGPVTLADNGVVIQDIGNGVGILHKASVLGSLNLGESIVVSYPGRTAQPIVERLDKPAPAQSTALKQSLHEEQHAQNAAAQLAHQTTLFPTDNEPRRPFMGPRM